MVKGDRSVGDWRGWNGEASASCKVEPDELRPATRSFCPLASLNWRRWRRVPRGMAGVVDLYIPEIFCKCGLPKKPGLTSCVAGKVG
jgi:hypothetical protein